jgi:hypothetical protein
LVAIRTLAAKNAIETSVSAGKLVILSPANWPQWHGGVGGYVTKRIQEQKNRCALRRKALHLEGFWRAQQDSNLRPPGS